MQRSRSRAIVGEIGIGFSSVRLSNCIRVFPGPQRKVRSCSGHSPPLSQTGQSSGWLTRMNSSVAFWPSAAFAELWAVRTFMPSCAVIVQPAWSFGIPSTSTRHIRQSAPAGCAEDGNLDPGTKRGLDEAEALWHLHLAAVDGDGDELGLAHAGTCETGECVCWSEGAKMPSSDDSPPQGQAPGSTCAVNWSAHFSG